MWKSTYTLFFIRLLLILIQFTGWKRKSNLQGWVGTRYERLEVIGAVLGRTHILLWRWKFFYSLQKKKDSRTSRTLLYVSRIRESKTMNTGMRNENISSPFNLITDQIYREHLSFHCINIFCLASVRQFFCQIYSVM